MEQKQNKTKKTKNKKQSNKLRTMTATKSLLELE